ncbi:MAG TPA: benzoate/H(+) symporter BenE family transporter [Thiolinea sp.]|nr:benzoate/H(+) symporter BenE family transporter [Thiolinea sp.]
MFRHFALSHLSAGFIAVLVGYTSSAAIVFQAAQSAGATQAQISSWLLALGIGMFLTSGLLSLRYRAPILTAWSTPGAALLITGLAGYDIHEATGIFLFFGVLTLLSGLTGWVEKLSSLIPMPIASAMLAGVLLRFGLDVFTSLQQEPGMVGLMFLCYLLGRRFFPRYTMLVVLGAGLAWAGLNGAIQTQGMTLSLARPEFVMPHFNLLALISVGIPLFIVTMTSQNLPGIAVLKAHGYHPPLSPIITATGVTTLVLAPFGGFTYNLAAITAAICMGDEAGDKPENRYLAAVAAAFFYLLTGLFGAAVVVFFAAIPEALILAVAGLALLGTIGSGLQAALQDRHERDAALITFLVTASGMVLWGVGSAFWGLVAGMLASRIINYARPA